MSWLEPLPDAEQQRAIDRWAIEELGIASETLMERAGSGLADVVARCVPSGRVAVVCGKGNNGGDGLVAARRLREAGRDVDVVRASDGPFEPGRLAGAAVIVDALLGTGFTGAPRQPLDAIIDAIGAAGVPVVAADVPSGVNGSTGEIEGAAVRATATATFHAAKPGLWIHPGKAHAGVVEVLDIGIPAGARVEPGAGLIGPSVLCGLPGRGADSTKFASGTAVVLGGSRGVTGAPVMAAHAAMRAGAGYVIIATGASNDASFALRPVESMLRLLPDHEGALTRSAVPQALEALARADAAVLGPGLGRSEGAAGFARDVYAQAELPLVLDADGINAFAGETPPRRGAPTVLTPHAGELGRLLGLESDEVGAHRLACARKAAAATGALVVLKGDDTLIAAPDGRVMISPGRAPGLATAGTGDVLGGVIAALLARGAEPEHATAAAVLAHVHAGRLAAEPHGPDGVIATDVIAALRQALAG